MEILQQTELLNGIADLLQQKAGLNVHSVGTHAVAKAVHRRMSDCGSSDLWSYFTKLQTSPQELDALLEDFVVPETWFFRDREPFAFLSKHVISDWLPTHPSQVLRILTVPCSTGEEPYSIAIALLEAGLSLGQFHIDAVDISKRSLVKARHAVYDAYSFRSGGKTQLYSSTNLTEEGLKERYFRLTTEGYHLQERIASKVNFIHGNLFAPNFLIEQPAYHVIFCRNLLIYLDSTARKQIIQVLDRLLASNGLLFVGHSEMGQLRDSRLIPVRHAFAFAAQKDSALTTCKPTSKPPEQQTPKPKTIGNTPSKALQTQRQKLSSPQTALGAPSPTITPKADTPSISLKTARELADQGQLDAAIASCETYLNHNRTDAEAYVLLGQVLQAKGREEEAGQSFQKAIYLQPNHDEALMHLALLKEQQGDFAGAVVLRQRIQRLHQASKQD